MRVLMSCALASLVLLPATAVRAQGPAFPGEGGVVSVVGGGTGGSGGDARPTVDITSDANEPTNEEFNVRFDFSESVTDFTKDDITVTGGEVSSALVGSGSSYDIDVTPDDDFDGTVTVTVLDGAARNGNNQLSIENSLDIEADTRPPRLSRATVNLDELILDYNEPLDESKNSEPDPSDFEVTADGDPHDVKDVDVVDDEVQLTLQEAVSRGETVRITYDPGSDPIQDEVGNEAEDFTNERVTNNTLESDDTPSAPRNLIAEAAGRTEIDLEWDAPRDEGASDITAYELEVSDDGRSGWDTVDDDIDDDDREYTDDRLEPGTRYFYRIRAINDDGEGEWSDVANAITEGGRPGAPTDLRATADGRDEIDLSWKAPSDDGGDDITGYRIEVSTNGNSWDDLEDDTRSTNTRYTHTGLDPGDTRHYRVSAINSAGAGEPSNEASATTEVGVPSIPLSFSASSVNQSEINLVWTAPLDDGGARITGYRIGVSPNGSSQWTILVANTRSSATSYTHRSLPPGTTRHYRVAAINSEGVGPVSRVVSATTRATVPDAPRNLRATAAGRTIINLSWQQPFSDGGARVSGYRVEYAVSLSGPWLVLNPNTRSTATSYAHRQLSPATTRHYRVFAINSAGTGTASNTASATTDATVPGAPTGLSATARGQSQIDLSWRTPGNDGGAPITGYRIEVSSDRGATWTVLRSNTNSTATTFPHTGLAPATTRHYRVYALNAAGRSPASNVANATTDATVPGVPTRLSAVANGISQIDLSWTAPSFDGGARITGYRVEVSETGGVPWANLVGNTGSSSTSYSHTGLAPATTRHYRVSAINSVGTGSESGVASATTDATVPDAPTNLVATATEPTRIDLTWVAPAYDGGAAVSSYRIEVSEDGGAAWRVLIASTGVTSTAYGDTGLRPGTTRFYRVSALNLAGVGAASNVATATTDDPKDRAGRVNAEVLSHSVATMTSSTIAAISRRIEAVATRGVRANRVELGGFSSMAGRFSAPGSSAAGWDASLGRLLDGASFTQTLGEDGPQDAGGYTPTLATWGGGDYQVLSRPRGGLVAWDGHVLSLHAGTDVRIRPNLLAGFAASRSGGNFDFTDATGASPVDGTYKNELISVTPYAAWIMGDLAAWVAGGYGWGDIEIADDRVEARTTNTNVLTGAVGISGDLLASGNTALRLKSEGWLSRVSVESAEGIDSLTLDIRRARVSLEWKQMYALAWGHEIGVLLEGACV